MSGGFVRNLGYFAGGAAQGVGEGARIGYMKAQMAALKELGEYFKSINGQYGVGAGAPGGLPVQGSSAANVWTRALPAPPEILSSGDSGQETGGFPQMAPNAAAPASAAAPTQETGGFPQAMPAGVPPTIANTGAPVLQAPVGGRAQPAARPQVRTLPFIGDAIDASQYSGDNSRGGGGR